MIKNVFDISKKHLSTRKNITSCSNSERRVIAFTSYSSERKFSVNSAGNLNKTSISSIQTFSPAARYIVESQSLNTAGLQGSAKRGLISKSDIILAIKAGTVKSDETKNAISKSASDTIQTSPKVASIINTKTSATSSLNTEAPVNDRFKDIPNSNMRKVIAKRLTESKATVPHFYISIECEIDTLMSLRKDLQKNFEVNVSVNDLVIKSAALALRDIPEANSKWNKENFDINSSNSKNVDISVAVATPNGLITPIVTGSDKRGLANINSTVKDLATRARDGKLKPEEYQGGSFSISNLGMFGITSFSAVINPPQACILAVGAGIKKVLPPRLPIIKTDEKIKPRIATTVTVQLSADRRVINEAIAAQYLQAFRSYLSNPISIIL